MSWLHKAWPWLLGLLMLSIAAGPLLGGADPPLSLHHLEHAFLMFGGGLLGISYVRRRPRAYGDPLWLLAILALGTLSLVLMLPDVYGAVDAQPPLHTALHVAFAVIGWLGGYAAERYAPRLGLGWQILVVVTGIITATGFGSPPPLG